MQLQSFVLTEGSQNLSKFTTMYVQHIFANHDCKGNSVKPKTLAYGTQVKASILEIVDTINTTGILAISSLRDGRFTTNFLKHAHQLSETGVELEERRVRLFQHEAGIETYRYHHEENHPK